MSSTYADQKSYVEFLARTSEELSWGIVPTEDIAVSEVLTKLASRMNIEAMIDEKAFKSTMLSANDSVDENEPAAPIKWRTISPKRKDHHAKWLLGPNTALFMAQEGRERGIRFPLDSTNRLHRAVKSHARKAMLGVDDKDLMRPFHGNPRALGQTKQLSEDYNVPQLMLVDMIKDNSELSSYLKSVVTMMYLPETSTYEYVCSETREVRGRLANSCTNIEEHTVDCLARVVDLSKTDKISEEDYFRIYLPLNTPHLVKATPIEDHKVRYFKALVIEARNFTPNYAKQRNIFVPNSGLVRGAPIH